MNSRQKGARGTMNDIEEWKAVCGYEGLYEVSNYGRVRSLKRYSTGGKVLKQYISHHNGYCYVSLSKNNKRISKRIHSLVMNAFCPVHKKKGYDKEHTIDHIDGDKTNNRLDNLEWCSQSENQIRAYSIGINAKVCRKVIDLDSGVIYESLQDAALSVGGKKASAISRVCKGQRSNYRNHRFAYYDNYVNGTIPKFHGRAKRSSECLWR